MLVLIKLVLPSNLSMPFSMGYWLSNAYDRVESSLPDAANPVHNPTRVAIESSLESTESSEIVFDNPALRIPATTKEADTLSITNELQSTDNMEVLPREQVGMDGAVGLTWQAGLFGLWFVVCIGTGLQVMRKTLLLKRLMRQAHPANQGLVALFETCRKRMLIGREIGLRVSSVIPTPAVYGFFRPIVYIPERMICDDFETKELEAIFTHELVHIQRSDLWVKLLQTILQVVYFYNPLLWLANATIRRVRELAVDEAVLVILGKSTSEVYPRTLLKVAGWALDRPMQGLRLIGVMESNHLLTERIKIMLQKPIPHSKKIGIIGLGILFILGVFLLPMARAGIQEVPVENAESTAGLQEVPAENAESTAGIQKDPVENAESMAKIAKELAEINVMKAEIESLQLIIQMKLDELHEKEAELGLMRQALNAKKYARVQTEMAAKPSGLALAAVRPSAGLSAAGSRGKQPSGGMMVAALAMPREPGVKPSGIGPSPAGSRGKQPSGGMMMGALAMPREPGVEEDSVLGKGALPVNISEEVRKELLRILPGLLRELLPKLLKEALTKTVENPNLIEKQH
jgi:beta-lactamase regulating signal transducer with metallopeptidase domain